MDKINPTICKNCHKVKFRVPNGKFPNNTKKFKDESGKTWNGLICGECHTRLMKDRMKNSRYSKKET
jgi:hypothetical protein